MLCETSYLGVFYHLPSAHLTCHPIVFLFNLIFTMLLYNTICLIFVLILLISLFILSFRDNFPSCAISLVNFNHESTSDN